MTDKATMNAVRFHRKGPPDVLQYERVARPEPGAGEVLVQLEAIGINYADVMRRNGDAYPVPTPLPYTLGSEAVGTIIAAGPGAGEAQIGAGVMIFPGIGCYADYAACPLDRIYPMPPGLDAAQCTALFVQGLSAALILRQSARMQPGETVLVQGAAGGVGVFAVQLAKAWGAGMVIAAAGSEPKRQLALELGADAAVDYGRAGWTDEVRELTGGRGVDIVLEMTGGQVAEDSFSLLAPFGRCIVFGSASGQSWTLDTQKLPPRNASVGGFWLRQYLDQRQLLVDMLAEFGALAQAGKLSIQIDRRLPLSRAFEAHALLESRATSGKLVLIPDDLFNA
jgi:NADPH:quinone reductase